MIDVCVIGYGPAGVSAALYLKRMNYNVVLIGKDGGSLSKDDLVENYYGIDLNTTGEVLINNGLKQAKHLGIEVLNLTVYDVLKQIDYFTVLTSDQSIDCLAVVLATGKNRIGLNVSGFNQFRGKGIHLCATCDSFFYRNKRLAIIGYGKYLLHELSYLERFTNNIIVFTSDLDFKSEKYLVVYQDVISFEGDTRLKVIKTNESSYEVDGCFIALGFPSSLELADKLGIITEKDDIIVDQSMQTNIEGIFAGGDVIGGKMQIAKSVYDGVLISDGVAKYLKNFKK